MNSDFQIIYLIVASIPKIETEMGYFQCIVSAHTHEFAVKKKKNKVKIV
jgi:hypothetical protein